MVRSRARLLCAATLPVRICDREQPGPAADLYFLCASVSPWHSGARRFCVVILGFVSQFLRSPSPESPDFPRKPYGISCAALGRMENHVELTERIIGCAIELHRFLGPGLLEGVYDKGLKIEFRHQGIAFERNRPIVVKYRGVQLGSYRPDFIVEKSVIVEVKSVSAHDRVFDAQMLTYLRLTGLKVGLLLNFGRPVLTDGIKRFVM